MYVCKYYKNITKKKGVQGRYQEEGARMENVVINFFVITYNVFKPTNKVGQQIKV